MLPLLLLACAGSPSDPALAGLILVSEDEPGLPLDGLDDAWLARFDAGDRVFETRYREAQGLGPAYIRTSCASCHADDARGPGIVEKMAVVDAGGEPADPGALLPWGVTVRPYVAGGATTPIVPPDDAAVLVTTRSPPAVFGRGWMEAVADDEIERVAAEQAARFEAGESDVSGRANRVPCGIEANPTSLFPGCSPEETRIGRFGLKARVPTLDGFAADAFQGDMSLTSPLRPVELANPDGLDDDALAGLDLSADDVNLAADYMRLLAVPARPPLAGAELARFGDLGCAECHVPALRTRADWPIASVADVDAPLFTDLLLHDMGEGFGDGLVEGLAGASEWRTAPLVGLRHQRVFLHDGRAASVEDAVLAHAAPGSEAVASVDAFESLSEVDKETFIAWLESL